MNAAVAATKLSELIREKSKGEPVNVHVVEAIREPKPDFEAMRKTIEGNRESKAPGTEKGESEGEN
jgi:hypothetical protein